jgi:hypothetical protein
MPHDDFLVLSFASGYANVKESKDIAASITAGIVSGYDENKHG